MLTVDHENLLAPPAALQPASFELPFSRVYRETDSARRGIGPVPNGDVPAGINRQRLAILIGDIVSYSRLVEEDGVGTVLQIRAMRRSILIPLAQRYRACICRGFGGDAVLMGFADPAAAIRCALDLRRHLATLCHNLPRQRRIRLRLGLSFGIGLMVDGTIYGTPVNVAARLQALAKPGGICISSDLVAAAQDSIHLQLKEMGQHSLKNIRYPVNVYRLVAARAACEHMPCDPRQGRLTTACARRPRARPPFPPRRPGNPSVTLAPGEPEYHLRHGLGPIDQLPPSCAAGGRAASEP